MIGPIEVQNEAGTMTLNGPVNVNGFQHPGFFVVTGPSVITQIVAPRPTLAYGDLLTVYGQNLARVGGFCVAGSGLGRPAGMWFGFRRPEGRGSDGMSKLTSNTQMTVVVEDQPAAFVSGPVQLFASTDPVGDYMSLNFVCTPNPQPVTWP